MCPITTATRVHPPIDLDAYLRRIDYRATVAPDLPTLRGLVAAHAAAIPIENLTPWLGLRVDLELPAIERKLLHDGRGGYCFEQNLLLQAALRAIGFEVSALIARVLWRQTDDTMTAQTHMLLRVDLDGETRLVDVGFGSQTLTDALRLQADIEQPTPLEPFRLVRMDSDWCMQSRVHGVWRPLYRYDLHTPYPVDLVVANHYVSTYPASRFTAHLIAARVDGDNRLSLLDREFTVRRPGHEPEHRTLRDGAEIRWVLEQRFRLHLPLHADLDRRLDELPA
jgi:N-hydroxyarylamine O-acetyltransferase